ncbi:MAG: flavodoxin [Butyrivibrio sp.]|nr:flavodoxin [Butyrivibrio sp.]
MKLSVAYYSLEGNIRYVAQKLADALGADLLELVPVKEYPDKGFKKYFWGGKAATMKEKPDLKPYSFTPDDYEVIVLCTPVWAGTFTPPFRTFLNENDMTGKKIAVVASSSGGNTVKCIQQLKEAAHAESLVAELSLIDPKDKPTKENEDKIKDFVNIILGIN